MTDKPLSSELRSQIVTLAVQERKELLTRLEIEYQAKVRAECEAGSHKRVKLPFHISNGRFYRGLAKELGIDIYAKCFGNLNMTETWEHLVHYESELPPPESIERTVRKANLPNESPYIAIKKATVIKEFLGFTDGAQIKVATDITPQSILQLPILPVYSLNLLPAERGLFFVMASKTEPKVIYVGKSQNLKASWEIVYGGSKCPIAGHRLREMTTLTNLGLDLYIRWLLLPATNETSVWQEDTDNSQLSLYQTHANKVLSPFFLGREIEGETTIDWGGLAVSKNVGKIIKIKTYRFKNGFV